MLVASRSAPLFTINLAKIYCFGIIYVDNYVAMQHNYLYNSENKMPHGAGLETLGSLNYKGNQNELYQNRLRKI